MNTAVLGSFAGSPRREATPVASPAEYRSAEAAAVEQAPAGTPAPQPSVRPSSNEGAKRVTVLRALLLVGSVAAATVAWFAASGSSQSVEPQLAILLRGMAAIKGLLAALGTGLVYWRFGSPVSARAVSAYIGCVWLLFVACALIWQLAFILLGAVLFHVGGIGVLLVAWHEGHPMSRFGRQAPSPPIEGTLKGPLRALPPAADVIGPLRPSSRSTPCSIMWVSASPTTHQARPSS